MFDERHDRIVQRGIAEAPACQDLLARIPVKPSRLAQARAWIVAQMVNAAYTLVDSCPRRYLPR